MGWSGFECLDTQQNWYSTSQYRPFQVAANGPPRSGFASWIIPDPPSVHARHSSHDNGPPVDNSSNDDWAARQRDQDNIQQMLNAQQMINNQQMQNDQQFQQQQQQMINDMNNH